MNTQDNTSLPSTQFAPGTFTPNPRRAPVNKMVTSQAIIEAKLFLRHGEQALLSFIIPVFALLAVAFLPVLDSDQPVQDSLPLMLAIAAMSSGFTGQAISLAFDRRYGALKRTGASGVPTWTIIVGKICGVAAVSILQIMLLTMVAVCLGYRTSLGSWLAGALIFFVGVAAFTALGMMLGGIFSAEIVLGVANLIWVAFVGIAAFVLFKLDNDPGFAIQLIPSVSLAEGIKMAFQGSFPALQIGVLVGFLIAGAAAATRWFRFS